MMKLVKVCGLCAILGIGLVRCANTQSDKDKRIVLVTTIKPIQTIVDELVKDSTFVLHTLLPQGAVPEIYEPNPRELQMLARSQAYLYMGSLGFETVWMQRFRELYPELQFFRLEEGARYETSNDEHHSHEPHFWFSLGGANLLAKNVSQALKTLAPWQAKQIDSLALGLLSRLELAEQRFHGEAKHQKAFVIYHPTLSMYAEERGFEQLVIEQDGKEPTPLQIQSLIERAKALQVRYVFLQQEFNPQLTQSIAQELGAEIVKIDPLGERWLEDLMHLDSLLHLP